VARIHILDLESDGYGVTVVSQWCHSRAPHPHT
jgi:hypothetical protein